MFVIITRLQKVNTKETYLIENLTLFLRLAHFSVVNKLNLLHRSKCFLEILKRIHSSEFLKNLG